MSTEPTIRAGDRVALIKLKGLAGTVEIQGADISNSVRRLTLVAEAGSRPSITLELATIEVSAESGPCVVRLDDTTHKALINMGWAPPDFDKLLDADAAEEEK